MYPNTLEGLFSAISNGSLQDAKKIIESGIDLNALHNNDHVINYTLNLKLPAELMLQIIECLVQAGAQVIIDEKQNVLAQFAGLFGELQNVSDPIIRMLANIPNFEDFYSQAHLQAITGTIPESQVSALRKDKFDLSPIYYATFAKKLTNEWFDRHFYDYSSTVRRGQYEGINLVWLLMFYRRYEKIATLLAKMPLKARAELFASAPKNAQNINCNVSFGQMMLFQRKFELFESLTKNFETLPVRQRIELLANAITNPDHPDYGVNPFLSLLIIKKRAHINRLTRDVENMPANVRLNVLTSSNKNPNNVNYKIPLIYGLILDQHTEAIEKLTRKLEPKQLFDLLTMGPMNPAHIAYGVNVSYILINVGHLNLFKHFIHNFEKELSVQQRFKLLSAAPANPESEQYRVSTAYLMVAHRSLNHSFNLLTTDFEKVLQPDEIYELLNASAVNKNSKLYGITLFWGVLNYNLLDTFNRLTQRFEQLSADKRFNMLMSGPKNATNKHAGITTFKLLLQQKQHARLLALVNGFSAEQNYELLKSATSAALDSEDNMLFRKLIDKLPKQQLIDILGSHCNLENPADESKKTIALISVIANSDNLLVDSILRNFSYDETLDLQRKISFTDPGYDFLNQVICNKLIASLTEKLTAHNQTPVDVIELSTLLGRLIRHFQETISPAHKIEISRKLSDLFALAIDKGQKQIFSERIAGVNFSVYRRIATFASEFALEGLAHYLQNVTDDENIVILSINHAQLMQECVTLEREIAEQQRQAQFNSPHKVITPSRFAPTSPGKSSGKNPPSSPKLSRTRYNLFPPSVDKENSGPTTLGESPKRTISLQSTPEKMAPLRKNLFLVDSGKSEESPDNKRVNPFVAEGSPSKVPRLNRTGNE